MKQGKRVFELRFIEPKDKKLPNAFEWKFDKDFLNRLNASAIHKPLIKKDEFLFTQFRNQLLRILLGNFTSISEWTALKILKGNKK